MGPILPFLPVYGKQLGVSPLVMGSITAVLPLLFLIAKPSFGFLVDHFRPWRRAIFVGLLGATSGCFVLMYFLPALPAPVLPDDGFGNATCHGLVLCADTVSVSFEICFVYMRGDGFEIKLLWSLVRGYRSGLYGEYNEVCE